MCLYVCFHVSACIQYVCQPAAEISQLQHIFLSSRKGIAVVVLSTSIRKLPHETAFLLSAVPFNCQHFYSVDSANQCMPVKVSKGVHLSAALMTWLDNNIVFIAFSVDTTAIHSSITLQLLSLSVMSGEENQHTVPSLPIHSPLLVTASLGSSLFFLYPLSLLSFVHLKGVSASA